MAGVVGVVVIKNGLTLVQELGTSSRFTIVTATQRSELTTTSFDQELVQTPIAHGPNWLPLHASLNHVCHHSAADPPAAHSKSRSTSQRTHSHIAELRQKRTDPPRQQRQPTTSRSTTVLVRMHRSQRRSCSWERKTGLKLLPAQVIPHTQDKKSCDSVLSCLVLVHCGRREIPIYQ